MNIHSTSPSFRRRGLLVASSLLAVAALSACSMFSSSPATLTITTAASAQVNPDAHKRPSPVVVRVFELKASTQFEQADFVSLFEKDQAVLAGDLVSRDEFVLRPGESKPVTKPLSPDTRFVGVMAAFRELERARWRAVVPVVPGKKNEIAIDLDGIVAQAKRIKP